MGTRLSVGITVYKTILTIRREHAATLGKSVCTHQYNSQKQAQVLEESFREVDGATQHMDEERPRTKYRVAASRAIPHVKPFVLWQTQEKRPHAALRYVVGTNAPCTVGAKSARGNTGGMGHARRPPHTDGCPHCRSLFICRSERTRVYNVSYRPKGADIWVWLLLGLSASCVTDVFPSRISALGLRELLGAAAPLQHLCSRAVRSASRVDGRRRAFRRVLRSGTF